jgi:hypothetical protein
MEVGSFAERQAASGNMPVAGSVNSVSEMDNLLSTPREYAAMLPPVERCVMGATFKQLNESGRRDVRWRYSYCDTRHACFEPNRLPVKASCLHLFMPHWCMEDAPIPVRPVRLTVCPRRMSACVAPANRGAMKRSHQSPPHTLSFTHSTSLCLSLFLYTCLANMLQRGCLAISRRLHLQQLHPSGLPCKKRLD